MKNIIIITVLIGVLLNFKLVLKILSSLIKWLLISTILMIIALAIPGVIEEFLVAISCIALATMSVTNDVKEAIEDGDTMF